MFGLNMQEFIGFVFPLKVLFNTGSENIVCGKVVLFILIVAFILKFFK